jgi:DNA-binding MarR family transcriptional regulator/GNAT superfamily N-acetyltransferase
MEDSLIAQVRAFNRFYTRQIGVLDEHVVASPYSLTEARVLYEIFARGRTTASELARELRLDRGYLSRIQQKFTTEGLLALTPGVDDRRRADIALTAGGALAAAKLDANSSAAVEKLLAPLDATQRAQLAAAMRTIRSIFGDASEASPVVLRGPRLGEFGWLIHRQGLLYNQQYGWNMEFEALIAGIYAEFERAPEVPPKQLWVAEQNGMVVGSVFAMPSENIAGSAQLRMLYVEPEARGQGIGKLLVDQCVAFARDAGYERMRLWTHSIQVAARKLYAGAGFNLVEEWDHESFGKQLHAEIWELRF